MKYQLKNKYAALSGCMKNTALVGAAKQPEKQSNKFGLCSSIDHCTR